MPYLNFPAGSIASVSEADIAEFKLTKNLGRPGWFKSAAVCNVGRVGRSRTMMVECTPKSAFKGKLKRMVNIGGGAIATQTRSQVKFFLNAAPIAPPKGSVHLQTLDSLNNPNAVGPRLNGRRLIRDDLTPIYFTAQGEKTLGLNAHFVARQIGVDPLVATPLEITKSSPNTIKQSAAAIDPQTEIEKITGNFNIEPGDTSGFPNGEVEFSYQFYLTDGLGRRYTIESGSFTVYTILAT